MTPEELLARAMDGPLLLDGALGSLLIAAGLPAGRAPESWVIENPARIEEVHKGYVDAGSDVIHTATFGATPPKLAAAGLAGRCHEINVAAVGLARSASAGRPCLVAGDIGPTGLLLPPLGTATEDEMRDAFDEQASALAEAGIDLYSIETMFDLREARAAVAAVGRHRLAVMASMTFEARKRGFFTIMGDPLTTSLQTLAALGADAVGCNCSVASDVMLAMVREAVAGIHVPLVAQPNAGNPRVRADVIVYDADPQAFAEDLAAMGAAGARFLGGCCGTDPGFIDKARTALDSRR